MGTTDNLKRTAFAHGHGQPAADEAEHAAVDWLIAQIRQHAPGARQAQVDGLIRLARAFTSPEDVLALLYLRGQLLLAQPPEGL